MPRELHTFYLVKLLPLRCNNCGTKWVDWTPTVAEFDLIVGHFRTRRCPSCDSGIEELELQENTSVDVIHAEPEEPNG